MHAGSSFVLLRLVVKRISCIAAISIWQLILPGTAQIFSQTALQMIAIKILILESSQMPCLLASFHLRSSSPNIVTVCGGDSRT